MEIRRANPEDSNTLNRLMHSSSAYQGEYSAMLKGYEITEDQLSRDMAFVAWDGKEAAGFYSLVLDPPELDLMFVADEYQGEGVGRMLFLHMAATAREMGMKNVKIVSHPPAAEFYKGMGAKPVGISPPKGRVTWERPILKLETGSPQRRG